MADQHAPATGHHGVAAEDPSASRGLALGLGLLLMATGLGLGMSGVFRPIGIPVGATGLLILLYGVFYAIPPVAAAGDHGHGHGGGHH